MSLFILTGATGVVFADDLQNQLDSGTADTTLDAINVLLIGPATTINVWLDQTNDSDSNCNLDGGDIARFAVSSSAPGVATFSPTSFQLTGCGSSNGQLITITPVAQGTAVAQFTFNSGSSTVDAGETFTANTGNFTAVVDSPPSITSTSPADGADDVAVDASITIDFSEPVDIGNVNSWATIDCTVSGAHAGSTTGSGTGSVTLNPTTDFTPGESCIAQVNKNQVTDSDSVDGLTNPGANLDNPAANYSFDFSVAAGNEAPDVDAGGPYSGNEGSPISITGTAVDPDGDSLTYAWSINTTGIDGGGSCDIDDVTALSTTVTCDDDSNGGTFTLTLTVNGDPDGSVSDTANLTVDNVAPSATLDAANATSVTESATAVTYNYTASDAGANDSLTPSADCGAAGTVGNVTASSFECTFLDGGPTPPGTDTDVTISVTDDELVASATDTQTVNVENANPEVATPTWTTSIINCGTSATLNGLDFSDAGTIDNPWDMDIDWDDGSTTELHDLATQNAVANQSHPYALPGVYQVSVAVTDKDGGSGSATAADLTVVQTYTVNFLQPLDASTPAQVIGNSFKNGRVLPVKATIKDDCTGAWVTGTTGETVTVRVNDATFSVSPGAIDACETFSDAGASSGNTTAFRWVADSSVTGGGYWVYNLDSSGKGFGLKTGSTYQVRVVVNGIAVSTKYAILMPTK